MWRKLTGSRYRVLVLHVITVGGMAGAWSAMIGLPLNQVAFFVIAGAAAGAGLPLQLLDAGINIPVLSPPNTRTSTVRWFVMFGIPMIAADILVLPPTHRPLAERILLTVVIMSAFPAVSWVMDAIQRRRV